MMRTGFAARLRSRELLALGLGMVCAVLWTDGASAQDAGRVKTVKGTVYIERGKQRELALVGSPVRQADTLVTGPDGAVGVTLADDTLLSAGPNSVLVIEKFVYEPNQPGSVEAALTKGTLAVVSGRIAKQAPDSMRVKTPSAILGVRGTEFVVRAGAGSP